MNPGCSYTPSYYLNSRHLETRPKTIQSFWEMLEKADFPLVDDDSLFYEYIDRNLFASERQPTEEPSPDSDSELNELPDGDREDDSKEEVTTIPARSTAEKVNTVQERRQRARVQAAISRKTRTETRTANTHYRNTIVKQYDLRSLVKDREQGPSARTRSRT
ncbi:hypothetical protein QCA50_007282 [Cerrena zonata]|uniref:Uncharacterized protein n=1 Tax=Cerrena zonata TaxID=2478898 RepID=A0AAW0G7R6_9APHY